MITPITTRCFASSFRAAAILRGVGVCLGLLASCMPVFAQSTNELRTLFFDPVYLDASDENVLLTSAGRPGAANRDITTTAEATTEAPSRLASEILADIKRYEDAINQQIETSGIYNTSLAQEYLATGNLYEQLGDIESAVAAYENAMHINRVNEGLYTLSQRDAVRALIDISKKTRNFADADKYHEYLYYILSRSLEPGSDAMTTASLEWAEWNLEAYRRTAFLGEEGLYDNSNSNIGATMLRRGELVAVEDNQFSETRFVPRTALLAGSPSAITMQSYTADQLIDPKLEQADDAYDNMLESTPDDPEILRRKANLSYLFKKQLEEHSGFSNYGTIMGLNRNRMVRSVAAIRRGYADTRENLTTAAEAAAATDPLLAAAIYLDLGDWELTFERAVRAFAAYNMARDLLLAQGMTEAEITGFVSPEPALLIPTFVSHEYTREFQSIPESLDVPYLGYIDVSFDVRTNGTLRRIDIINVSENTGQRLRSMLLDHLEDIIMRPLFVAGETVEQSDIKVRYYYAY